MSVPCTHARWHCLPAWGSLTGQCIQIYRGKAYESWYMSLWLQHTAFARAYDRFFGPYGLGPMPDIMHYVCCAQVRSFEQPPKP